MSPFRALARLFRASSPENPTTPLSNPDAWVMDWSGAGAAPYGPPVSETSAMTVAAVYRCVALKSGIMASLPLRIYRDDPKSGQVEVPDHQFAGFFGITPYPGRAMTSFAWREAWGINVDLWGNHYSIIRYNNAGRVLGFEPQPPSRVTALRMSTGRNAYDVLHVDGTKERIDQDDMLHIAGLGFDGLKGASRIQAFARNSISLAKLFEEQTGRAHENATRPSGAVTVPPNISADGFARQKAYFTEQNTGRLNAGRVLWLDQGQTFTPYAMSSEDLQTIEARRFQIADICRFFGVPPHLVGEAAGTSAWGSGIESLTTGFLIFTLESELQRVEAELRLKLFAGTSHYPRFDRAALRAMDVQADAAAAQTEINSGVLTINERRRFKQRAAVEGGDEPMINSTMLPLSRILNPPAPATPPAPQEPKP